MSLVAIKAQLVTYQKVCGNMAIDKKAWYRRLHLNEAMKQQELRQKHNMQPLEGPWYMGHDDPDCEECSLVRSNGEKSKFFVRAHVEDPRNNPSNLNHGNSCEYCNTAVLNDMTRNDHFDTGSGEGK